MGVGVFGKIAGLGDFIRGDLPPGFEAAWDRWLQQGIVESRAALGARWAEAYSIAPIWRFALGPGLAGPGAVAGVLMPSQDRVGRMFPLTLVAAVPADRAEGALADEDAMVAMEEAALDTLDAGRGRGSLDAALGRLRAPAGASGPPLAGSLWRAVAGEAGPLECRFAGLPTARAFIRLIDPGAGVAA